MSKHLLARPNSSKCEARLARKAWHGNKLGMAVIRNESGKRISQAYAGLGIIASCIRLSSM